MAVTRTLIATSRTAMVLTVVAFAMAAVALAADVPALSGRVVDQANILSPSTRLALDSKLADLEERSGIQLVVASLTSLDGQDIEPYANSLFRFWKLGEAKSNNGVLLLIAPNEKRVRIEVGYGLEGTLTDALSKVIITNAIAPRFKAGDFNDGVSRGVDDIITVLTTDASEWQKRPSLRLDNQAEGDAINWLILGPLLFGLLILLIVSPSFRWFFFNMALALNNSAGSGRSGGTFGGGSAGGGGFSGGGGSSGGGGASGSW